jgi:hypothetical protein
MVELHFALAKVLQFLAKHLTLFLLLDIGLDYSVFECLKKDKRIKVNLHLVLRQTLLKFLIVYVSGGSPAQIHLHLQFETVWLAV